MKVLHLLTSGGVGGIETLAKNYSKQSKHDNYYVFTYTGGDIAEEMKSRGDKCVTLNHSKKAIIKTFKYIDNLVKKEQFSVIVVQPAAPVLYIYAIVLRRKYGTKFVAYAHSDAYDMVRFKEKNAFLRNVFMKELLHRADGIIAISKYVKKTVRDIFNINDNAIEVIYNGVDTSDFIFKESRQDESTTLNIIYVGRLIKEKGVQILVKAIDILGYKTKIKCYIVGSGKYENELKKIVEEKNLGDRIEFLGRRRDIDVLLGKADVFIHPALWQEGFGITIVEAMSAGKICICSNCGAIPELIDDGINGYLFKQGDADALAEKIYEVSKLSEAEIDKITNNAREKALKFDIKNYVAALDKYISSFS